MDKMKKGLGALLALIALAVAINSLAGEFYGSLLPHPGFVWDILNWFMAGAILVALAYQYLSKRALDKPGTARSVNFQYLYTNLLLFVAIVLTLWFFHNWFNSFSSDPEAPSLRAGVVWIMVNAIFIAVTGITAGQLWRRPAPGPVTVPVSVPEPVTREESRNAAGNEIASQ